MSNYPDDCAHKQCPWDDPEPIECECGNILDEDQLEDGVCGECSVSEAKGEDTSKVHLCGNRECCFNKDLYCSVTGTECFGYMLTAI